MGRRRQHLIGRGSASGASYGANPVQFDGVADYLTRGAALTGAVDGKQFSIAVAFKFDGAAADQHLISGDRLASANAGFGVGRNASNQVYLFGLEPLGATVLHLNSSAIVGSGWHTLLASVDLTSSALRHLYIDDISDINTVTTYVNSDMDFTGDEVAVGTYAGILGNNIFQGEMADLWFNFSYIDFSVAATRRKFFTALNAPAYKGSDGSLPTGSAPIVFLSGPTSTWHTNLGSGGGFTENGALVDGTKPVVAI